MSGQIMKWKMNPWQRIVSTDQVVGENVLVIVYTYIYTYTYIHKTSTTWNTAMCKYEWLIHIKLHLHLHICWLMIQYTPMQKLTSFIGFFPTWLFEPSPLEGTSINSWLLICLIRLYGKSFRETGSLKWWKKKASTWGFQAIWKILVKLDHFPR